jgi:hypothetical protein
VKDAKIIINPMASEYKYYYHIITSSLPFIKDTFSEYGDLLKACLESEESFQQFWMTSSLPSFDTKQQQKLLLHMRQFLFDHIASNLSVNQNQQILPLQQEQYNQEYHTLECDADLLSRKHELDLDSLIQYNTMHKQQLLQQFTNKEKNIASIVTPSTPTTPITPIASSTGRKKNSVDRELNLLMGEQKRPWKKTDDDSINQLYDHIYRVWKSLNDSEAAEPFRKPVKKSQAKDYYDVIAKPIDLSAMLKKIKSLTYKSKSEFAADLQLMFDNCREYNTDLESEVLVSCAELEQSAHDLLKIIPAEENVNTSTLVSPHNKQIIQKELNEVNQLDRDERWNVLTMPDRLPQIVHRRDELAKSFAEQEALLVDEESFVLDSAQQLLNYNHYLPEYNEIYMNVPNCDKYILTTDDKQLLRQYALNMGIRTKDGMKAFLENKDNHSNVEQLLIQTAFESDQTQEYIDGKLEQKRNFEMIMETIKKEEEDKKQSKEDIKKEEEDDREIVPLQLHSHSTTETTDNSDILSMPTLVYNISNTSNIGSNVQQILEIKKMKKEYLNSDDGTRELMDNFWDSEESNTIDVTDSNSAKRLMRSIVCMFLSHQGFDSAYQNTIDLFTDVMDAYILKFGKILNYYTSLNTNNVSMREALLRAVQEMGVSHISELYNMRKTIDTTIEEEHERLLSVRRKVENALQLKSSGLQPDTTSTTNSSDTANDDEDEDEVNLDLYTSSIAFGSISDIVSTSRRSNKRKRQSEDSTVDPASMQAIEQDADSELIPIDEFSSSKKSKRSSSSGSSNSTSSSNKKKKKV